MKKTTILSLLLLLGTGCFAQQATDSSHKITGDFEWNYLRHYLWRGAVFGNDDVAQPMLNLRYKNFTLGLSQNLNYVPKNVPKSYYTRNAFFDEQDVELGYKKNWGKWTNECKAMAYFYFYQRNSPNTAELYNKTSFGITKTVSVFTENSVDIVTYGGAWFSNNGLSYSKEWAHGFSLEGAAFISFANKKFNSVYYATEKSGTDLIGIRAALYKDLGKFCVGISAEQNQYTSLIKPNSGLSHTSNFGIAAGFEF
jgi:hypothetical protein